MIRKLSPVSKWALICTFLFFIFLTLLRLVFFEYYKPAGYTFSNTFSSFTLGAKYDMRIAACITLPLLLIGNLSLSRVNNKLTGASLVRLLLLALVFAGTFFFLRNNKGGTASWIVFTLAAVLIPAWLLLVRDCSPFRSRLSERIWKGWFLVAITVVVIFYAVDFQHYDYLHQRLNASVMNYTEDAKISFSMVWQTYPVIRMLLLIGLVIFLLFWLVRLAFRLATRSSYPRWQPVFSIFLFLVLASAIWGKASQFPLRWSDAFAFGDEFRSSVALNPLQSFFSTLQFRHSGYDEIKVRKYYPLIASWLGLEQPDSIHLNYQRDNPGKMDPRKPNVVLVICESFSAYKSSMYGNPLNTTPYFNGLCNQGIFFDRCFTPAYGTARGVWAAITGIPDVEIENTASRNPAAVDQHTIFNDFSDYKKLYFLGGSTSWANIRGLLTNNIKDLALYEEGSYKASAIDIWGISDKNLFLEANGILARQANPFIALIQTADNHRPYTIPDEDLKEFSRVEYATDTLKKYGFESNAELNAFRYTDYCYKKFIESARKEKYFNNTVFVFVGDHGIRGNAGNMFPACWNSMGLTSLHVPLLFYSPALLKPARVSRTCSQIDVLPTVAGLAGIPYRNSTLGRDLFDSLSIQGGAGQAFLFDPEERKAGMISGDYCYLMNLTTGTEQFASAKNNISFSPGDSTQAARITLRNLTAAIYETAKYMILNNKKGTGRL